MVSYKELFIFLSIYLLYQRSCFVYGAVKGSLGFVIDHTFSMTEEIGQVKQKTHEVFDAVLTSNGSAIDDFVLVTFNDPGFDLRIVTRDKYAYKREVDKIILTSGGDCPELPMTGIELALQNSKPNSFLYVFTDASAKDYYKFERVKSLSLKKSTQVTFLLTGLCDGGKTTPEYVVYEKLSKATSGQIFNIGKQDVNKILDFIIESIKYKKTTLGHKSFGSSGTKQMTFTVDSKIWDVIVSVSAASPNFHVFGPDNAEVSVEKISGTPSTYFGKLETVPGNYTIVFNNDYSTPSVLVTGSTSVTFQHGFSTFKPSSINETSTKPIPDQPSFLSIELDNDKRDVLLDTVELRDENDNFITELPLAIVNDERQFYTTKAFNPPPVSFKVVIHGHTPTNEKITRVSPTTIEYQKPDISTTNNLTPKVVILEGAKLNAEYKKPLALHCKVTAYPKPDVVWLNEKGESIPSKVDAVDFPYEYMSILNLENVAKNGTLTCRANNFLGKDETSVNIEIKTFLNVLEYPSDTTIEYGTTKELKLKVDSVPTVTIVWYKGDNIINNNENFELTDEKHTLAIKDMHPGLKGNYAVEMSNGFSSKRFDFKIFISGTEPPKIDKSISNYHVKNGSSVDLSCRVIKGKPKPIISWFFYRYYIRKFKKIRATGSSYKENSYHIERVDPNDAGTYKCKAHNDYGEDSHEMDLIVEYAPMVEPDDLHKIIKAGKLIQIPCIVDGVPNPTVRWLVNGLEINVTKKYTIYEDNTLRSEVHDSGVYTCEASNPLGKMSKDVRLDVFEPPKIDKSIFNYYINSGFSVDLPCRVIKGTPKPIISWSFDPDYSGIFEEIRATGSSSKENNYHIEKVDPKNAGAYKCTAYNDYGEDSHEFDLIVEYAPTVKTDDLHKIVKAGEIIQIPCIVDGEPTPSVRWLVNGLEIHFTRKYRIYQDNTLRSEVHDSGVYTCEASNPLGKMSKDVRLDVYVPVDIEAPEQSIIELKVGDSKKLPCTADGLPEPNIEWLFFSKDPKIAPKTLLKDITNSVVIERAQLSDEGIYTCVASNAISSSNITYEVNVQVPPAIVNTLPEKTFEAVTGDLVLRIPCKAEGRPKPTVTWAFENGFNIVTGSEWYDVDEDGTLIIKNIDEKDAGIYICKAENSLGLAFEYYKVIVHDSTPTFVYRDGSRPSDSSNTTKILLEEGKSHKIKCEVPFKKIDMMRWYKNGRLIKDGDLILSNVTTTDSGIYSCRVSNFRNSHTSNTEVIVGFKPSFIFDEETNIDFSPGAISALSCEVRGEPNPKIQWWRNGQLIEETTMVHFIFMEIDDIGQYTCKVSNEFGNISRTFNIIHVKECTLNIDNNFQLQQPLLYSSDKIYLPTLRSTDGLLKIPAKRNIFMFCPNSFVNIDGIKYGEYINAFCVDNSIINVNGEDVDFSNIKCNDKIVPLTKSTGESCGPGNTELLNIGYDVGFEFLGIYDICIDKMNKLPHYIKHVMYPITANTLPTEEIDFEGSRHLPFQFEDMYNCWQQRKNILSLTGKRLSADKKCCFAKRQLVSPRDVLPGHQVTTYNYLNVIPKWGTCGTQNWDKVEERVRSLVKALEHPLEVYTGTSHLMKLPAQPYHSSVYLVDRYNNRQPVPRYIWKVVINHYESEAVAIIQINIPDITPFEAFSFMLCKDICHKIEWMRSTEWKDVNKGFTFCCNVLEFERAFGFKDNIFKIPEYISNKVLII